MQLLTPENWKDYELLDVGDFEKLERFGSYVTIRPEPQAVWPKIWSNADWEKQAHVKFIPRSSSAGDWKKLKQMPDQWKLGYEFKNKTESKKIQFRLGLTSFKHVGVFPEQAVNWDAIFSFISGIE
jgi:23S rRNA (cytosine1962-C5)-methyltransferase